MEPLDARGTNGAKVSIREKVKEARLAADVAITVSKDRRAEIERLQRENAELRSSMVLKDSRVEAEKNKSTLAKESYQAAMRYVDALQQEIITWRDKLAAAEVALDTATEFLAAENTFIRKTVQRSGQIKWKVARDGEVLAKDGEWEWEPLPSSRDDEFLGRTRYETFDSARAALGAAKTGVKP